jgi:hypothetical protein
MMISRSAQKCDFCGLCAMSTNDEQAFFYLLFARCLDPNDQNVIDMLRKRHPKPAAMALATIFFDSHQRKRNIEGQIFQTMTSVSIQDLGPKFDQYDCPICQCKIKSFSDGSGQIREARLSSCDHCFHELCVRTYLSYDRTTCQLCRHEWKQVKHQRFRVDHLQLVLRLVNDSTRARTSPR